MFCHSAQLRHSALAAKREVPSPQALGWEPLGSAKIYGKEGSLLLTGDVQGSFTELALIGHGSFDKDGPIWTRPREDAPGFFDIAVLWSDPTGTNPRDFFAVDKRRLRLG